MAARYWNDIAIFCFYVLQKYYNFFFYFLKKITRWQIYMGWFYIDEKYNLVVVFLIKKILFKSKKGSLE